MSALQSVASLAVDSRFALADRTAFTGQPVAVSVAAPSRKVVATSVSCRADGDNKRPSFVAQIAKAVVPALSSAIIAASVIGMAPAADAMQSYLLTGGVASAQAEEVAVLDDPTAITPEERARRFAELLRKKREEQEAVAAAARAAAEQKAAEEEAARRFAEEKIRSERLFVRPELKPSNTVAPAVKDAPKEVKKNKRGGLPLFVSQFGLLAAYGGGIAALFLLPEEKWKEIEEKLEEVKDAVLPIVDDVVIPFAETTWEATQEFAETAKPYAEAAYEAAKPVAEAAYEAAKPVAEKALEAAKPVADQALERVKELAAPVVSQVEEQVTKVGESVDKVREVAGPVVSQVRDAAGPVVSQVQEKTAEFVKSVEGQSAKPKA